MSTASTSRESLPTGKQASNRKWLSEIITEVKARPSAIVVYGVPGGGKTSFAAFAPDPLFIHDNQEDGLTALKQANLIPNVGQLSPVDSWPNFLDALNAVETGEHNFKTLVIDTIGGMEKLCHSEVCRRDYNNDWGPKGFGNYQQGYRTALIDWRQFLQALDRIRDKKQMRVILLAHSQVVEFKNPVDANYDHFAPNLHKDTWGITHQWADACFFLNFVTYVKDADKTTKKGKGIGGSERVMKTSYSAAWTAKNRFGLTDDIDMGSSAKEGWNNFVSAIKTARTANSEVKQ